MRGDEGSDSVVVVCVDLNQDRCPGLLGELSGEVGADAALLKRSGNDNRFFKECRVGEFGGFVGFGGEDSLIFRSSAEIARGGERGVDARGEKGDWNRRGDGTSFSTF